MSCLFPLRVHLEPFSVNHPFWNFKIHHSFILYVLSFSFKISRFTLEKHEVHCPSHVIKVNVNSDIYCIHTEKISTMSNPTDQGHVDLSPRSHQILSPTCMRLHSG